MGREDDTPKVVGLLRLRECCLFTWRESLDRKKRTIVVESHHCSQCIVELQRIGVDWQLVVAKFDPPSKEAS